MQILDLHDAGHRDQDVDVGWVAGHLVEGRGDRVRVGDVESDPLDAVLRGDPVQQVLAPAADDHGVAEIAEPPRQAEAESRRTAGDEDRVSSRFHVSRLREPEPTATRLGSATARQAVDNAAASATLESWSTPNCPISCANAARPCSPRTSGCLAAVAVVRRDSGARRSPYWRRCRPTTTAGSKAAADPSRRSRCSTSIARALRLTLEERDHLFVLAGHGTPPRDARVCHVDPGMLRILDRLHDTPALLINRCGETLAQTPAHVAFAGELTNFEGHGAQRGLPLVRRSGVARRCIASRSGPPTAGCWSRWLRSVATVDGPKSYAASIVRALQQAESGVRRDLGRARGRRSCTARPSGSGHPAVGELELYCELIDNRDQQQIARGVHRDAGQRERGEAATAVGARQSDHSIRRG